MEEFLYDKFQSGVFVMSIIRNKIPILEFDTDDRAVLMPDHEKLAMSLPEKAVFAFLGSTIDDYAMSHDCAIAGTFVSITKDFPVYITDYRGETICLVQAPAGAPVATSLLDWLIAYGVKKVISAGSCGVLEPIEENRFLVPYRALRDEGTSYHYLEPSRYVDINPEARKVIEKTLVDLGLEYEEVVTWTTDGFFRETRDKVASRRQEGCTVVEMECSALASCAERRGILWGEILYTADSLANFDSYNGRGWGIDSLDNALVICLEIIHNM